MLASFKGKQTSFYTTVQSISIARQMFTIPGTAGEIPGYMDYYFSQRIKAKVE